MTACLSASTRDRAARACVSETQSEIELSERVPISLSIGLGCHARTRTAVAAAAAAAAAAWWLASQLMRNDTSLITLMPPSLLLLSARYAVMSSRNLRQCVNLANRPDYKFVEQTPVWDLSFFLFWGDTRSLRPSHASAEACLTGWPNAQPQGRD